MGIDNQACYKNLGKNGSKYIYSDKLLVTVPMLTYIRFDEINAFCCLLFTTSQKRDLKPTDLPVSKIILIFILFT